jgi:hypothetical protein
MVKTQENVRRARFDLAFGWARLRRLRSPTIGEVLQPLRPSVRLSQRTRENHRIGSGSAMRLNTHPGEITAHDGPTTRTTSQIQHI